MSEDSSSDDEDYQDVERPFHIVCNWSMTGDEKLVEQFCKKINYASIYFKPDMIVSVAPPAPYLSKMRKLLKERIGVCAQNCCHEEVGAFTGEVSTSMLRNVKATGVVCGHWERRRRYGEDPGVVALQVLRATENRLTAYFCIGESLQERKRKETMDVIASQIKPLFELPIDWKRVVIVYEPVWSFKDEGLVACEVQFPPDEEDEVEDEDETQPGADQNVNTGTVDNDVDSDDEDEVPWFDGEKFELMELLPKTQHIDDLFKEIRQWLRSNASKRIAWTTPILYGGHLAAEAGSEFTRLANIDGLLVDRKSLILDDIDFDGDPGKLEADDEFEDFIQLIHRCGEERSDEKNLNRDKLLLPSKKVKGKKNKKRERKFMLI